MFDIHELMARQARRQKDRSLLTWAEKVRIAEAIRESVVRLRSTASKRQDTDDRAVTKVSPPKQESEG